MTSLLKQPKPYVRRQNVMPRNMVKENNFDNTFCVMENRKWTPKDSFKFEMKD